MVETKVPLQICILNILNTKVSRLLSAQPGNRGSISDRDRTYFLLQSLPNISEAQCVFMALSMGKAAEA
jgi:hypothetical protein